MTHSASKGKNIGLRSTKDEDGVVRHCKEKIEQKLMRHNRKHLSKVKYSNALKDKEHRNMANDNIREKWVEK